MIHELQEFIITHTVVGACLCDGCYYFDRSEDRGWQPSGENVYEMIGQVVKCLPPEGDDRLRGIFIQLINENPVGYAPNAVNFFAGKPIAFAEAAAYLGDNNLTYRFFALGHHLGAWHLSMPKEVFNGLLTEEGERVAHMHNILFVSNPKSSAWVDGTTDEQIAEEARKFNEEGAEMLEDAKMQRAIRSAQALQNSATSTASPSIN